MAALNLYFKTSYVEVYRNLRCYIGDFRPISKHLMLKFITFGRGRENYCNHFKTSYVEVYQEAVRLRAAGTWFQNILCWSLSESAYCGVVATIISKHLMLKFIHNNRVVINEVITFQNILCWSLSCPARHTRKLKWISKHLMLKFIQFAYDFPCVNV